MPYKIRDLDFMPHLNTEFITTGKQHMALWKFKGGLLSYEDLPIENPKGIVKKEGLLIQKQADELKKQQLRSKGKMDTIPGQNQVNEDVLKVEFLALIFLFY
jgi:hypothetical protein